MVRKDLTDSMFTTRYLLPTRFLLLFLAGSLPALVGCGSTPQAAPSRHFRWRVPLGEAKTSVFSDAGVRSLSVRDGEVIAAGWRAERANEVFRSDIALAAYDAETGQVKWTVSRKGLTTSAYAPMAMAGERIYTATTMRHLLILEGARPAGIKAVQYGLGRVVLYPVLSDARTSI